MLALPSEEIRIGKLVRETEGQPAIVECFDATTNTCRLSGHCRLKGVLAGAVNAFYEALDRQTLQDLVTGPQRSRIAKVLLTSSP